MTRYSEHIWKSFLSHAENLEALLDSINDGVYVTDLQRRIVYWNRSAEEITGFSREEVAGKPCHAGILQHRDEQGNELCSSDLCPLNRAMATGKSSNRPIRVIARSADGGTFTSAVSVAPVRDKKGTIIGGVEVFRDISEDLELERLKSEFLSTVSHELKTPLTSIIGYLDLVLEEDAGEVTPEQQEFLTISLQQAEKLQELIMDILEIQKMESGALPVKVDCVDLVAMIEQLFHSQEPLIRKKKLEKVFVGPEKALYLGDRQKLEKILGNLISNAVRYTEQGSVAVVLEKEEEGYKVSVKDTGVGLSRQEQQKVFDRFYRADNSLNRSTGGTGLGLYIVKTMLEKMGGEITLESEPGKGTCFTVLLPFI